MKKNRISKNWISKQHRDLYFIQSKIEGYRSRSAYKLIEINKKFKIFEKNNFLLDIGSSPGGWSQVASQIMEELKEIASHEDIWLDWDEYKTKNYVWGIVNKGYNAPSCSNILIPQGYCVGKCWRYGG